MSEKTIAKERICDKCQNVMTVTAAELKAHAAVCSGQARESGGQVKSVVA